MNLFNNFDNGKQLLTSLITWLIVTIVFAIYSDETKNEIIFRLAFTLIIWVLIYYKSIIKLNNDNSN